MGEKTKISWTNATWNPTVGCTKLSSGCDNCYAVESSVRLVAQGNPAYRGVLTEDRTDWSGQVNLVPDRLDWPYRKQKPLLIFVNSMSDLFHPQVPYDFAGQVFATMMATPRHTYQVLTKRPERMARIVGDVGGTLSFREHVIKACEDMYPKLEIPLERPWPLPNVWLGTSIETERWLRRIGPLRQAPAAARWLSLEPLLGPLGPLDLNCGCGHPLKDHSSAFRTCLHCCFLDGKKRGEHGFGGCLGYNGIDWVVVGGESGPNHREMDIGWLLEVVVQCDMAGVPVHVKQDSGPRPGQQGRIPNAVWARKEYPR